MFGQYSNNSREQRQRAATGITGRARVKRVFANDMVAHVWAQQTQDEGRSSNGNFYFDGDTLYSYGRHFAVARFTGRMVDGQRVVLTNSGSYSVTTSGHMNDMRRALARSRRCQVQRALSRRCRRSTKLATSKPCATCSKSMRWPQPMRARINGARSKTVKRAFTT
jgi:hypothetical protein